MTLRIKCNPKYIAKLHGFVAVNEIRFFLEGMFFEKSDKGGINIVATCGAAVAVAHDKDGRIEGQDSAILRITKATALACKKAKTVGKHEPKFLLDGKRISLAFDFGQENTNTEYHVQGGDPIIEANFPDWRRVIPKYENLERGGLHQDFINPEYLKRIIATRQNSLQHLAVWQERGGEKPLVIQDDYQPEILFLIMQAKDPGDSAKNALASFYGIGK